MASEIRITVIGGEQNGETFTAPFDRPVKIGRSSSKADITLKDKTEHLSGLHFEIRREGDGVVLLNVGKNETLVDGAVLASQASRRIAVGMEVEVRKSVRFRFDSLGDDVALGAEPPTGSTLATRATMTASATLATMTASATRGTNAVEMTQTTRAAEESQVPKAVREETVIPATQAFDMGMFVPGGVHSDAVSAAGVPQDAVSDAGAAQGFVDGPTTGHGDGPTTGSPADKTVAMSGPWSSFRGARSTGSGRDAVSTTDDPDRTRPMDGETQGGQSRDSSTGTNYADFEALRRQEEIRRQKEFYRRVLLGLVMGLFLAALGFIIWYRWPRPERYLTVPLVPGTEKRDYSHQVIKDKDEQQAFVAYYPHDGRMKETALPNGGLEVSTFLGRDRDVSFWMRVTRRDDPAELDLSLEASVERIKGEMAKQDQVSFLATPEWANGGYCFLESEYWGASHGLWRGTRMFRTEYRVRRNGLERHGVLFVLRNRTTVWRIERDIPEFEWERGKIQLRVNPNVEFFADYLEGRWESPGRLALLLDADLAELEARAVDSLEKHDLRPSEWGDLAKVLDTLVYKTVAGPADRRRRALQLLDRFRTLKDNALKACRTRYLKQEVGGSRDGVARAGAEARAIFGANEKERYCDLVGDLETWTWQKKR